MDYKDGSIQLITKCGASLGFSPELAEGLFTLNEAARTG